MCPGEWNEGDKQSVEDKTQILEHRYSSWQRHVNTAAEDANKRPDDKKLGFIFEHQLVDRFNHAAISQKLSPRARVNPSGQNAAGGLYAADGTLRQNPGDLQILSRGAEPRAIEVKSQGAAQMLASKGYAEKYRGLDKVVEKGNMPVLRRQRSIDLERIHEGVRHGGVAIQSLAPDEVREQAARDLTRVRKAGGTEPDKFGVPAEVAEALEGEMDPRRVKEVCKEYVDQHGRIPRQPQFGNVEFKKEWSLDEKGSTLQRNICPNTKFWQDRERQAGLVESTTEDGESRTSRLDSSGTNRGSSATPASSPEGSRLQRNDSPKTKFLQDRERQVGLVESTTEDGESRTSRLDSSGTNRGSSTTPASSPEATPMWRRLVSTEVPDQVKRAAARGADNGLAQARRHNEAQLFCSDESRRKAIHHSVALVGNKSAVGAASQFAADSVGNALGPGRLSGPIGKALVDATFGGASAHGTVEDHVRAALKTAGRSLGRSATDAAASAGSSALGLPISGVVGSALGAASAPGAGDAHDRALAATAAASECVGLKAVGSALRRAGPELRPASFINEPSRKGVELAGGSMISAGLRERAGYERLGCGATVSKEQREVGVQLRVGLGTVCPDLAGAAATASAAVRVTSGVAALCHGSAGGTDERSAASGLADTIGTVAALGISGNLGRTQRCETRTSACGDFSRERQTIHGFAGGVDVAGIECWSLDTGHAFVEVTEKLHQGFGSKTTTTRENQLRVLGLTAAAQDTFCEQVSVDLFGARNVKIDYPSVLSTKGQVVERHDGILLSTTRRGTGTFDKATGKVELDDDAQWSLGVREEVLEAAGRGADVGVAQARRQNESVLAVSDEARLAAVRQAGSEVASQSLAGVSGFVVGEFSGKVAAGAGGAELGGVVGHACASAAAASASIEGDARAKLDAAMVAGGESIKLAAAVAATSKVLGRGTVAAAVAAGKFAEAMTEGGSALEATGEAAIGAAPQILQVISEGVGVPVRPLSCINEHRRKGMEFAGGSMLSVGVRNREGHETLTGGEHIDKHQEETGVQFRAGVGSALPHVTGYLAFAAAAGHCAGALGAGGAANAVSDAFGAVASLGVSGNVGQTCRSEFRQRPEVADGGYTRTDETFYGIAGGVDAAGVELLNTDTGVSNVHKVDHCYMGMFGSRTTTAESQQIKGLGVQVAERELHCRQATDGLFGSTEVEIEHFQHGLWSTSDEGAVQEKSEGLIFESTKRGAGSLDKESGQVSYTRVDSSDWRIRDCVKNAAFEGASVGVERAVACNSAKLIETDAEKAAALRFAAASVSSQACAGLAGHIIAEVAGKASGSDTVSSTTCKAITAGTAAFLTSSGTVVERSRAAAAAGGDAFLVSSANAAAGWAAGLAAHRVATEGIEGGAAALLGGIAPIAGRSLATAATTGGSLRRRARAAAGAATNAAGARVIGEGLRSAFGSAAPMPMYADIRKERCSVHFVGGQSVAIGTIQRRGGERRKSGGETEIHETQDGVQFRVSASALAGAIATPAIGFVGAMAVHSLGGIAGVGGNVGRQVREKVIRASNGMVTEVREVFKGVVAHADFAGVRYLNLDCGKAWARHTRKAQGEAWVNEDVRTLKILGVDVHTLRQELDWRECLQKGQPVEVFVYSPCGVGRWMPAQVGMLWSPGNAVSVRYWNRVHGQAHQLLPRSSTRMRAPGTMGTAPGLNTRKHSRRQMRPPDLPGQDPWRAGDTVELQVPGEDRLQWKVLGVYDELSERPRLRLEADVFFDYRGRRMKKGTRRLWLDLDDARLRAPGVAANPRWRRSTPQQSEAAPPVAGAEGGSAAEPAGAARGLCEDVCIGDAEALIAATSAPSPAPPALSALSRPAREPAAQAAEPAPDAAAVAARRFAALGNGAGSEAGLGSASSLRPSRAPAAPAAGPAPEAAPAERPAPATSFAALRKGAGSEAGVAKPTPSAMRSRHVRMPDAPAALPAPQAAAADTPAATESRAALRKGAGSQGVGTKAAPPPMPAAAVPTPFRAAAEGERGGCDLLGHSAGSDRGEPPWAVGNAVEVYLQDHAAWLPGYVRAVDESVVTVRVSPTGRPWFFARLPLSSADIRLREVGAKISPSLAASA